MKYYIYLFSILVLFSSCGTTKSVSEPSSQPRVDNPPVKMRLDTFLVDKGVVYNGRIGNNAGSKEFYWSGTSAKIKFIGKTLKFAIQDKRGDNYYNAILDGVILDVIRPDSNYTVYEILSDNHNKEHIFELLKISEWTRGTSLFYGFDIGDGTYLEQDRKKKTFSFYGNSITAGYAVDDLSGKDSPDSTYTNFFKSYARITADYFDANYYAIARSGIGIMISWFDQIMPELYNRLDPSDKNSKWDFKNDKSEYVIVNLFQNDEYLVNKPDYPTYKKAFANGSPSEEDIVSAYKSFISKIRIAYPHAKIICMLGNMGIVKDASPWKGYVTKAVKGIKDEKIYTFFATYKGTPGHPNEIEQKTMAQELIRFIEGIDKN